MVSSPAPPAMPVAAEPAEVVALTAPVPASVTLTLEEAAQAPPAVVQSAAAPAPASPADAVTEVRFTIVSLPAPPSMPVAVESDVVDAFAPETPASVTDTARALASLWAEALIAARLLI